MVKLGELVEAWMNWDFSKYGGKLSLYDITMCIRLYSELKMGNKVVVISEDVNSVMEYCGLKIEENKSGWVIG